MTKESTIIGFSICAEIELAYYVILSYWDVKQQKLVDLETKQEAKEILASLATKDLVMHNALFDCWMVENNYNIKLMPAVHTDTMILAHLVDENRRVGLKELGVSIFGEDSIKEQKEMKASVTKNGGVLTKDLYELYKGDAELIAYYGAKDTILTLKVFYHLVPQLYDQGLDTFFYEEESMPLLRGATYHLNTVGLKVDPDRLAVLKRTLEADCFEAKAFILKEIDVYIKNKYPGTSKAKSFNIGASKQLAWLLFFELNNEFNNLTEGGKELCKALDLKIPYSQAAKREFISFLKDNKDMVYEEAKWNPKTKKMSRPKKIGDPWNYLACGKETLSKLSDKYKWVKVLLDYAKNLKLLNTYVEGIQSRMKYNVIRPSFLQHGTTSGRYSSRNPNFQNLPRDDKRIKSCIVARPGKSLVGADYSQLEPRVFASFSKDERLLNCFKNGDDFYSVIGVEVFEKFGCSLKKDDKNSFAKLYPELRQIAKVVALSATYGTTAPKMALAINKSKEEAQEIIDLYFEKFPGVKALMLESHAAAKNSGVASSLFGRLRRMPDALSFNEIYGEKTKHGDLPYEARNTLNLAVNHRIQATGASIVNRASIAFLKLIEECNITDCTVVMQVHDELIVECKTEDSELVRDILKVAMEETTLLPGVELVAEPKIASNIGDLK